MNKILLTGRLTKDIDLRYNKDNIAICAFTLAVQRNYKNNEGNYEADFINCISYRNTAELMAKFLKKGDKIEIEGRLQVSSYTDKNDIKRTSSEVVVERLGFLQVRKEEDKLVVKEEPKKEEKLSDDVFADFGRQIEITDEEFEVAF